MRFVVVSVLVGLLGLAPSGTLRGQDKPELMAQLSNGGWLRLVDGGQYGESWEAASAGLKGAVAKTQWEKAMTDNRAPLGKMAMRTLASSAYSKTLPGAPDGEYVVTLYTTQFEHKESAQETVISVLEKDGQWRVAGYYFK
jgi:hypothetical protein